MQTTFSGAFFHVALRVKNHILGFIVMILFFHSKAYNYYLSVMAAQLSILLVHYLVSNQCRVNIGPPAKRHLNGVSLVGRWWPVYRCLLGSFSIFLSGHDRAQKYTLIQAKAIAMTAVDIMVTPGLLQTIKESFQSDMMNA